MSPSEWTLQDLDNVPLRPSTRAMTQADFDYIAAWTPDCGRMPVVLGRGGTKRHSTHKRRNRKNKKRK